MCEKKIESVVKSFTSIYAVVIALAISEAFMQFVLGPDAGGIQWARLPSLCSLLLLVVAFYHGMLRHSCEFYGPTPSHHHYGMWLLVDCLAFTVEAALFFTLARSLPVTLWKQFNWTVVALLCFDVLWGSLIWKFNGPTKAETKTLNAISLWVIVNLCTIPFLTAVLLAFPNSPWWGVSFAAFVVLARTVADYWAAWSFYFPDASCKANSTETQPRHP